MVRHQLDSPGWTLSCGTSFLHLFPMILRSACQRPRQWVMFPNAIRFVEEHLERGTLMLLLDDTSAPAPTQPSSIPLRKPGAAQARVLCLLGRGELGPSSGLSQVGQGCRFWCGWSFWDGQPVLVQVPASSSASSLSAAWAMKTIICPIRSRPLSARASAASIGCGGL